VEKYKTINAFNEEYFSKPENNMQRFLDAQNKVVGNSTVFQQAIEELAMGRKVNHWMWFIFPQLRGLGESYNSNFYGLDNLTDAGRFLDNDELRMRIIKCFNTILNLETNDPVSIFGSIDAQKLLSCATLFSYTYSDFPMYDTASSCGRKVLQKFFNGQEDNITLKLMKCVNVNELAVYLRALIDPFADFASAELSRRFEDINVPNGYIEPTQENLFAPEEFYIEKAIDLCNKNNIGYFRR